MGKRLERYFTKEDKRMPNMRLKRCVPLLAITEMEIKTMTYQHTLIRVDFKMLTIPHAGSGGANHLSCLVGEDTKWSSHFARQFGNFL